jgi:hypothetical protein
MMIWMNSPAKTIWEPSVDVDAVVLAINPAPSYRIRIRAYMLRNLCNVHTGQLNEKSDDVTRDENLCQPPCPNQTVRFCIDADNDATQCHVYASSKKGRSDEQKKGLNHIGSESQVRRLLM